MLARLSSPAANTAAVSLEGWEITTGGLCSTSIIRSYRRLR
jgi:hypothetical protein